MVPENCFFYFGIFQFYYFTCVYFILVKWNKYVHSYYAQALNKVCQFINREICAHTEYPIMTPTLLIHILWKVCYSIHIRVDLKKYSGQENF